MRVAKRLGLCGMMSLVLASCGGGGSSAPTPPATGSGVFKDANVSGLSFQSGGQTGVTGPDGSFTYEVGQPVTFSVGGVVVGTFGGTSSGQAVVTPLNIVPNGTSSTLEVLNVVRFLLMLDTDGDSSNGIRISPAVQTVAASWAQVDFSTSDLTTALAAIIAEADTADGTSRALPDAATAQAHLEATLRCARSGAYRGTYSGTDSGPFGVMIDAQGGLLSGYAFSPADQALLALSGTSAVSFDQSASFISGNASSGATFAGNLTGADQVAGTWQLPPTDSGTFAGSRIGGSQDALFRFTGTFMGDAFGTFSFDVDASDNVQGTAHTVFVPGDQTIDELSAFSGSVSGTSVTATVVNNAVTEALIAGTLDKATGALSGAWCDTLPNGSCDPGGNSGSFSGSGCKLN